MSNESNGPLRGYSGFVLRGLQNPPPKKNIYPAKTDVRPPSRKGFSQTSNIGVLQRSHNGSANEGQHAAFHDENLQGSIRSAVTT